MFNKLQKHQMPVTAHCNYETKIMTNKILKSFLPKALVLPLLLTVTSCGGDPNLPKVRQFSLLSDQAAKQLPVITKDLYLSCLRTARFKAISLLPPYPDQRPATARLQDRVDEQKTCDKPPSSPRQLSSLMDEGNGVIVLYMKKLGQLASEDLLKGTSINQKKRTYQLSAIMGQEK